MAVKLLSMPSVISLVRMGIMLFLTRVRKRSKGLSNRVCVFPYVDKNIENTNKHLKYEVICFVEGHGADSAMYDLWELQIQ